MGDYVMTNVPSSCVQGVREQQGAYARSIVCVHCTAENVSAAVESRGKQAGVRVECWEVERILQSNWSADICVYRIIFLKRVLKNGCCDVSCPPIYRLPSAILIPNFNYHSPL